MATRSLRASAKGIEKANLALDRQALNQNALAEELEVTRQPVNKFFQGKPVDRRIFAAICNRLGLELEAVVLTSFPPVASVVPVSEEELEALVQSVRQAVAADIKERCGKMRVLDMTQPIALDTIYTDVNILKEITGRRRLDLAQLSQHTTLEDFDRFGFAQVTLERVSGLEAVERFDKLMLLGKPGAGKTTFMKRLATLCSAGVFQAHRVPLFVPLRDFAEANGKPGLLDYMGQQLTTLNVQTVQAAELLLNHGRVLILLDGLDEVRAEDSRRVLQEIRSFSDRFPTNAFVITCRIAAKEYTFQAFTDVEVADFNDEQIADFATKWFAAKGLDKTERFLQRLKENGRIRELAASPLLLTLLCLIFEGRTDFPANRSELYEEGVDVLLKKWDGTRSIEREQVYKNLSLKRKEDLLSQTAFTTFEQGDYFFKQKAIEQHITTYIQNLPDAQTDPKALLLDSEAILKSVEAQHGLLVARATGIYSFSHLTFHEYFTARRVEKHADLLEQLVSHVTETRWREVFLLTAGMLESADALMQLMKTQIDQLVGDDDKLQQFLVWVTKKVGSVEVSYKPAAVRAYYVWVALDLDLDPDLPLDLALALDSNLARDLDFESDRAVDLDLDLDSNLAFVHARTHARTYGGVRVHDPDLPLELALVLKTISDSELTQALQILKNQLPDPEGDQKASRQWWKEHGGNWSEQLRGVMIQHRNIGHNWQFSEAQANLLEQYYAANKLLVDCLNSDCYVTRSVREEIEATLLLPHSLLPSAQKERQKP